MIAATAICRPVYSPSRLGAQFFFSAKMRFPGVFPRAFKRAIDRLERRQVFCAALLLLSASTRAEFAFELGLAQFEFQGLQFEHMRFAGGLPPMGGPLRLRVARVAADPDLALPTDLRALFPLTNVSLACNAFAFADKRVACEEGQIDFVAGDGTAHTFRLSASGQQDGRAFEFTLETDDFDFSGINVAENVRAEIAVSAARQGKRWRVDLSARLHEGLTYLQPGFEINELAPGFLVEQTTHTPPMTLRAVAEIDTSADLDVRLRELEWLHPGVVECAGGLRFAVALGLDSVRVSCEIASLRATYETWLAPLLLSTAISDLEMAGAARVDIAWHAGVLDHLVLGFENAYLDDAQGRFGISALNGDFILQSAADPQISSISFAGASVFGLPFGATRLAFTSAAQHVQLAEPAAIPVLGGAFRIHMFDLLAPGLSGQRLVIEGGLTPITLAELCAVFACPAFAGTLAMEVPKLTLAEGSLTLDGALRGEVFDGRFEVTDLKITDILGRVPHVEADFHAYDINLAKLTSAVDFGRIEGTVDIVLADLELANWAPVNFDFSVRTIDDDARRHRISKQAVDNIGELGAGRVVPMSQGPLSWVNTFSYGELALGCIFRAGACWLSGLDGAGHDAREGFTLLSMGGLLPPWIEIRGNGRLLPVEVIAEGYQRIREGNVQVRLNQSR